MLKHILLRNPGDIRAIEISQQNSFLIIQCYGLTWDEEKVKMTTESIRKSARNLSWTFSKEIEGKPTSLTIVSKDRFMLCVTVELAAWPVGEKKLLELAGAICKLVFGEVLSQEK